MTDLVKIREALSQRITDGNLTAEDESYLNTAMEQLNQNPKIDDALLAMLTTTATVHVADITEHTEEVIEATQGTIDLINEERDLFKEQIEDSFKLLENSLKPINNGDVLEINKNYLFSTNGNYASLPVTYNSDIGAKIGISMTYVSPASNKLYIPNGIFVVHDGHLYGSNTQTGDTVITLEEDVTFTRVQGGWESNVGAGFVVGERLVTVYKSSGTWTLNKTLYDKGFIPLVTLVAAGGGGGSGAVGTTSNIAVLGGSGGSGGNIAKFYYIPTDENASVSFTIGNGGNGGAGVGSGGGNDGEDGGDSSFGALILKGGKAGTKGTIKPITDPIDDIFTIKTDTNNAIPNTVEFVAFEFEGSDTQGVRIGEDGLPGHPEKTETMLEWDDVGVKTPSYKPAIDSHSLYKYGNPGLMFVSTSDSTRPYFGGGLGGFSLGNGPDGDTIYINPRPVITAGIYGNGGSGSAGSADGGDGANGVMIVEYVLNPLLDSGNLPDDDNI